MKHASRPGIRHAAICPHTDKTTNLPCGTREFFATDAEAKAWRCPTHNMGKVQENRPYFGQATA